MTWKTCIRSGPTIVRLSRVTLAGRIMGLGPLGRAAAEALRGVGIPVRGRNATPKELPGVETHAGPSERDAFLHGTRSLVCLLPLTAETRGILSAAVLTQLPPGAGLINVGRGGHLVEADLLSALDAGHLSSAVLDVLVDEPPAAHHPVFRHPRVIVTPHIASTMHPATAAREVVAAIDRHRSGAAFDDVVERRRVC